MVHIPPYLSNPRRLTRTSRPIRARGPQAERIRPRVTIESARADAPTQASKPKKKKKKSGGLFGGLKKLGGALKGAAKAFGKAFKKALPYIDMLSPALLLVPGVGPALYAGYNIMKTAYYAANGDLKQAFFSGMAAMTGVGGVAGKVASYAQKGMQIYQTAQGVMNGDVEDVVGAIGLAAGGIGGDMGAKIGKAAQVAGAGLTVKDGLESGNLAAVAGGVAAGAGAAGDAKFVDPETAARIQEVATQAGRGAAVVESMMSGDAVGAISGLSGLVDEFEQPLGEELGVERLAKLKDVLRQGQQGAIAFEALRRGRPAAAMVAIGQLTTTEAERAQQTGAELAKAAQAGDGDGMRLQAEALTSQAGVTLKSLFDGDYSAWKRAMSDPSPLAVSTEGALAGDAPLAAFDRVREAAQELGRDRSVQRAALGLALAEAGFRAAEELKNGDSKAALRAFDFAFALSGVDDNAALPSAAIANDRQLGAAWEATRRSYQVGDADLLDQVRELLGDRIDADTDRVLDELAPWIERGMLIAGDRARGDASRARERLFDVVEDNGVALP